MLFAFNYSVGFLHTKVSKLGIKRAIFDGNTSRARARLLAVPPTHDDKKHDERSYTNSFYSCRIHPLVHVKKL